MDNDTPIRQINICHEKLILAQDYMSISDLDGNGLQFLYNIRENENAPYHYSAINGQFSLDFPKDLTTATDGRYKHYYFWITNGEITVTRSENGDIAHQYDWSSYNCDNSVYDGVFDIKAGREQKRILLDGKQYATSTGIKGFLNEKIDMDYNDYLINFEVESFHNTPFGVPDEEPKGYYFIRASGDLSQNDKIKSIAKKIIDSFKIHLLDTAD